MTRCGFIVGPLLICFPGAVISSDNREQVDTSVRVDPRQIIEQVLTADMTPEARMKALERYIDVGRSEEEIEKLLGSSYLGDGYGPGFMTKHYRNRRLPSLIVEYYPDGEALAIKYASKDGSVITLRSDDPITWPKTTDGKNARLRPKKER
jgi:hypothetical protein